VLLTQPDEFHHVVVLGAPACGKTTLLQKMRYWAAITAYQDEAAPLPVFVYLVGLGLGCIVALYCRLSTSYHIH
jgi:predicted NACHT family NTPase